MAFLLADALLNSWPVLREFYVHRSTVSLVQGVVWSMVTDELLGSLGCLSLFLVAP